LMYAKVSQKLLKDLEKRRTEKILFWLPVLAYHASEQRKYYLFDCVVSEAFSNPYPRLLLMRSSKKLEVADTMPLLLPRVDVPSRCNSVDLKKDLEEILRNVKLGDYKRLYDFVDTVTPAEDITIETRSPWTLRRRVRTIRAEVITEHRRRIARSTIELVVKKLKLETQITAITVVPVYVLTELDHKVGVAKLYINESIDESEFLYIALTNRLLKEYLAKVFDSAQWNP